MYRAPLLFAILVATAAGGASAQGARIVGTVTDQNTRRTIPGVQVTLEPDRVVTTDSLGRFVFLGVPPGRHRLLARAIGYQPQRLTIAISLAEPARLDLQLWRTDAPVELRDIEVTARPLQPTDIPASVQTVGRAEIVATPVVSVGEVLELRPGVSEGHFRGGRVGQATLVIDGLDVRDQFALSQLGTALDLSPTAVEEVAVTTGGFATHVGNALSGVVEISTRRGSPDGWRADGALLGGQLLPDEIGRGYARTELGAGGPLRMLGRGSTLRLDAAATTAADADPRRHGLTCLAPAATDACLNDRPILPHHRGDDVSLTGRLDLPVTTGATATVTGIWVREQEELYGTRFKYNLANYLAERRTAAHLAVATQWQRGGGAGATLFSLRAALTRTSRYLGVPEPGERPAASGLPFGRVGFRGEDFVNAPLAEQLASGSGVPGYGQPQGGPENPYGRWGADLFVTRGTSEIVQRHRSDALTLDAGITTQVNPQHVLQAGVQLKLLHITAYQRAAAWSPGATPSAASFFPRVAAAHLGNTFHVVGDATVTLGVRVEAFDPRIAFSSDRRTIGTAVRRTGWSTLLQPRVGFVTPLDLVGLPRTVARWNFGLASQPPAFQFFFDTAIDDSLNTLLRRQGNPTLGFERATQYEVGVTHAPAADLLLGVTGYYKDLTGLVTSGVAVGAGGRLFSNLDHGRVQGLEVTAEWRPRGGRLLLAYTLQQAYGIVATAFDSAAGASESVDLEVPLSFDRRHAIDVVGYTQGERWHWALTATAASGSPIPGRADGKRLPWSVLVNARAGRTLGRTGAGRVAVFVEGRNVLRWRVLRAARPETGTEAVDADALDARAQRETAGASAIPRESADFAAAFDRDGDGLLSDAEQYAARRAALLDAADPSLFFGPPRTLRVGVTIGR